MSCKHYLFKLEEKDRHYVPDEEYNNCVLCVAEYKGPMSQEEVSKYFDVGKVRISQIEIKALKKLKKKAPSFELTLLD